MTAAEYDTVLAPIVEQWKGKEGNVIMILHEIQNQLGYVPRDAALYLSRALGVPLARIYEVITFYNYFKLEPPGRFRVAVCMGTACYLKGAPELVDEFRSILQLNDDATRTPDGLFELEEVRCLGCCGLAPVLTVNGEVFGRVKKGDVPDIIETFQEKAAAAAPTHTHPGE